MSLSFAQLAGRCSLRDIVSNLDKQRHKNYHLGIAKVSRSSLARMNEQQPYPLYEGLFWKQPTRCQSLALKDGFRFKNKLYSLDASTIDLWAPAKNALFPRWRRQLCARILRYHLYTAVARAVLPCTHETMTIFSGALKSLNS
ncbi:MAG: DUF4372 domain-containing protein [Gammaproteobacteria bacterium]|nr:DUF4372 domain-containing protein [Gammaproteobacteria bacterium]